jgi:hypothetical protein
LEIAGWNGKGKPVFNTRQVRFNGKGELNHETFAITSTDGINEGQFCKTNRKPYDLLVVACLIAAWKLLDYRFGSDAFCQDGTSEDLREGLEYYKKVIKAVYYPIEGDVDITMADIAKQRQQY